MPQRLAVAVVAAAAFWVACSSGSKPPESPKPEPDPVPSAVVDTDVPAPPPPVAESCPKLVERFRADTGTNAVKPEDLDKMSEVLARHCGAWPASVVQCLVTSESAHQDVCMKQLDPALQQVFMKDLIATMQQPVDCRDAITFASAEAWGVAPSTGIPDPDASMLARGVLRTQLPLCEAGWSEDIRACLAKTPSPRSCLEPAADLAKASAAALAPVTALYAKAAAFKPTDKKISCAKVAAAHYGDKQWQGKLADRTAAERKQAIKASTAALTKACTDESWSPLVRGCVVAAKSEEQRGWCLASGLGDWWGYPAGAVAPSAGTAGGSTGVPACDRYVEVVMRYANCDKLPPDARQSVVQAVQVMRDGWNGGMPPEAMAAAADGCTQAIAALEQSSAALGCPL